MKSRRFLYAILITSSYIFSALTNAPSSCLFACDDAILTIITGVNPSDRYSGILIRAAREIRLMAGDINAYNHQAAKRRLAEVMKLWMTFDNMFAQNPPAGLKSTRTQPKSVKHIADLIGEIKNNLDSEKIQSVHNLLEPLVIELSILGSELYAQESTLGLLRAELALYLSRPGLPGRYAGETKEKFDEFLLRFEEINSRFSAGTIGELTEKATKQANQFKNLLLEHSNESLSRKVVQYNLLIETFADFKREFLEEPEIQNELKRKLDPTGEVKPDGD